MCSVCRTSYLPSGGNPAMEAPTSELVWVLLDAVSEELVSKLLPACERVPSGLRLFICIFRFLVQLLPGI